MLRGHIINAQESDSFLEVFWSFALVQQFAVGFRVSMPIKRAFIVERSLLYPAICSNVQLAKIFVHLGEVLIRTLSELIIRTIQLAVHDHCNHR